MVQRLIDHFVYQTQITAHISARDVMKRLAAAALMAAVTAFAGFAVLAAKITLAIVAIEALAYPLNRKAERFEEMIDLPTTCLVWLINWAAMLSFLAFAVVLSTSDTVPFVLAGFIWIFGIYVHVSNTFGLLPVYNWSQMMPAFAAMFIMLYNIAKNPAHNGSQTEWLITASLVAFYIVNTFDTMNLQKTPTRPWAARAKRQTRA